MPRAVVAGGAGFIGSHLVGRLLDQGWEVVVLDNLITGREANLERYGGRRIDFRRQDVSETVEVEGEVDGVFHLASPASPKDFPLFPIQIVKVGTVGTHNLLGLARAKGARFLMASTSEVYGDPLVHPQREDYWGNVNPLGPRGCYDESKRCAEAFCMAYHRAHGLETRILRIFNTYGPLMRMDDGRAVPSFLGQALAGQPLTVYGDGSQTRSLCFVDDLVEGLLRVFAAEDPMPFNIGNPNEVTILELARLIIEITGSRSAIETRPLPEDDPKRRQPDITRARTILSWEPTVGLEDGLRRTLASLEQVT